jgi:hypothetical protein
VPALLPLLLLLLQSQRSNMRVLLYDPAVVVGFLQLLTKLVDQSSYWSVGRKQSHAFRAAAAAQHNAAAAGAAGAGTNSRQPVDGSSSSSTGLERQTHREACWQIYFARSASGRLLLRLEYLLATGRQEEVGRVHNRSKLHSIYTYGCCTTMH